MRRKKEPLGDDTLRMLAMADHPAGKQRDIGSGTHAAVAVAENAHGQKVCVLMFDLDGKRVSVDMRGWRPVLQFAAAMTAAAGKMADAENVPRELVIGWMTHVTDEIEAREARK